MGKYQLSVAIRKNFLHPRRLARFDLTGNSTVIVEIPREDLKKYHLVDIIIEVSEIEEGKDDGKRA